ncbi:MAG: hypothetical protein J1G38_07260 [Clostridiales bacterium]|nr:hypothetical protein [Clostridiales bacterium]
MKTRFAKIVDRTVGAAMLFAVLTAVFRYYTVFELAAFSAASITVCAFFIFGAIGKRNDSKAEMTKRTDDMFYDFMFERDGYPAKKLADGLKTRGVEASVKAGAVYAGNTAAFFCFDKPLDKKTAARMIAKAKRAGAAKAVVFCVAPPASTVDVKDFTLKPVVGDDVYKLFASLKALPERRFEKPTKARFSSFKNALSKDKIIRYFTLSASLFGVSLILGFSIVPFVCAVVAAVLFTSAVAYNIYKKTKRKS